MDKKSIVIISAVCGFLVILACGIFGFKVMKNTKDVEDAAAYFVSVLMEGDLTKLELECYTYSEEDNALVYDENGQAQVRVLTKQQLADKYGTDVMKIVEGESEEDKNAALLKTIMEYSVVKTSVKTTFGDTSSVGLYMEIPDIKAWIKGLSIEELGKLAALTEGHLEDLEERMASGEITRKPMQFRVPMKKQNNKWRFEVTEEIENAFFGGLYNLFDEEGTDADALAEQK